MASPSRNVGAQSGNIRFLGQVFGVFLLFELPDRILMLDQHAAHEKLIYEKLGARLPVMQEMLFPLSFDASRDEEERISASLDDLAALGITVRRVSPGAFEVTAVSEDLLGLSEEDLLELVRGEGGDRRKKDLRATAACKMAIKEGETVDELTAQELCAGALELSNPRCPHGRPIWHEITREALFHGVERPTAEWEGW